jgi:rod shape-determining protein MreD
VLNLFLFVAFSFVLVGANPRPGDAWVRLFVDLLASQLLLALVTPWFFALQVRAFDLARLDPATGRRVSP